MPRGAGESTITILHLSSEPVSEEEERAFKEEVAERVRPEDEGEPKALLRQESPVFFEFRTVERSLEEDVIELSRDYARMVVPVPPETSLFRRRVIGQTSRKIIEDSHCPVVLVRRREAAVRFNVQTFFQFFRELEPEEEES